MTVVDPADPVDPPGERFGDGDRPDASRLRALGIDPWADDDLRRNGSAQPRSEPPVEPAPSAPGAEPVADTPLWLSHHWPADYDRCAVVAGLHVCRRCLVLYPLALVAGIAVSVGSWWDHSLDPWVLWLFPLPGVIEFVLDNLRIVSYRPVRQMVLSAGGALAAGVGYVRYLDDTTDTLAWTVLAVYTAATLAAAVVGGLWRRKVVGAAGTRPAGGDGA